MAIHLSEEKQIKRIDNFPLYIYGEVLAHMRNFLFCNDGLSQKSRDLFSQLVESIHNDIGHLDCDEIESIYMVEEGRNLKNKE